MVDWLAAVYDLVLLAANAAGAPLDPGLVFRAWANRAPLPPGTNEFATMTTLSLVRRGTNVYRYDGPAEVMNVGTLYDALIQVDFWGSDDRCLARALALEALAASPYGVDVCARRGVASVECQGGIKDMTETGDANQHVRRGSATLRIMFWAELGMDQPGTPGPLNLHYFEDVDAFHPPSGRRS